MTDAIPVLAVRGLAVADPAGRRLLDGVELLLSEGEIVLLVGPSGVGKTTLLRLLAGVLPPGWSVEGQADVRGARIDAPLGETVLGSLVFQEFALFEDLTAGENVEIVIGHAGGVESAAAEAGRCLVAGFERQFPSQLSGGQRQRTSIARALVAGKPLLLLDEPNSGLDRAGTDALLDAVAAAARDLGKPVLIVAHHFEQILPHAHRVLCHDPARRRLEELPLDGAAVAARLAGTAATRDESPGTKAVPPRHAARGAAPPASRRRRFRTGWMAKHLWRDLWQHMLSLEVLLYMMVASVLVGFTNTWFTLRMLPLDSYVLPVLREDIVTNIGFANLRIVTPLMVSVLMAARSGAVIASRFGQAAFSHQVDAMRNLGVPHRIYWYLSTVLAMLIASLALTFMVAVASSWVSLQTFLAVDAGGAADLWRDRYYVKVLASEALAGEAVFWICLKALLCGFGTAVIAMALGLRPVRSNFDIDRNVSLAISGSISTVLLIHTALSLLEFA